MTAITITLVERNLHPGRYVWRIALGDGGPEREGTADDLLHMLAGYLTVEPDAKINVIIPGMVPWGRGAV